MHFGEESTLFPNKFATIEDSSEKINNLGVMVVNSCYDCGFISAKTNGPYFGNRI